MAIASLALAVTACTPARFLSATTASGGARVKKNIAYGQGPRHRLDVYAPAHAVNAPVAVFFYGGSWQSGDRQTYQFVGSALAAKGIVTVIPDYRLFPAVHYEGFLDDGARAVHWARDHARQYGGDPSKLFLVGHSAGAYMAAMLALDKAWLGAEGLSPRDLRGFVGISGPYDFLPSKDKAIAEIFSTARTARQAEPIYFASPHAPPTLLLHGTGDTTVYPRNSAKLGERLRKGGADPVEVRLYPRVGHLGIIGAMGSPLRFIAPTLADTAAFIEKKSAP